MDTNKVKHFLYIESLLKIELQIIRIYNDILLRKICQQALSIKWIAATFVGACFSSLIYDYKKFGLDFALPAMFIGLLISSLKENSEVKKTSVIVIVSAIVLIVSIQTFSVNTGIIISAVIGAVIGGVIKK